MPASKGKSVSALKPETDKEGLDRLIFFSDAVFAIAITLLILDIRLPAGSELLDDTGLFRRLLSIWPQYMAYVISFVVIGLFWTGHHRKFRLIQRYDNRLLLLNLFVLMLVAFIPFPTSVLSESGSRTATIFYALTIIMAGLVMMALWFYASINYRLIDPAILKSQLRREIFGPVSVIGVFVLSIGLAFFDVNLARLSWLLVAIAQRFYQ